MKRRMAKHTLDLVIRILGMLVLCLVYLKKKPRQRDVRDVNVQGSLHVVIGISGLDSHYVTAKLRAYIIRWLPRACPRPGPGQS